MKIELAKEELRHLLDMAYMGQWVINSHAIEEDPRAAPYNAVNQKLLAMAYRSGEFDDLIEYDAENSMYWHTRDFDDAIDETGFIKEYDEHTFWEELVTRMAHRDVSRDIEGNKNLATLSFQEHMERIFERESVYSNEFQKHGMERLFIKNPARHFRQPSGKNRPH